MRYPSGGQFWKHKRKGTVYTVLRLCRIRNYGKLKYSDGSSGKWHIGVIYFSNEDMYVRDADDFLKNFMKHEPVPLPE